MGRIFSNELEKIVGLARKKSTNEKKEKEYSSKDGYETTEKYSIADGVYVFRKGLDTVITNNGDENPFGEFTMEFGDNGVYIYQGMGSVRYIAINNGNSVFSAEIIYKSNEDYAIEIDKGDGRKRFLGNIEGDKLLDIIEKNISGVSEEKDKATEVLLNDFKLMLTSLGIENLKPETEEEIVVRKATEEMKRALKENEELKKENLDLKTRFMKVRSFMTERCAKIPFFGKKLLREMQMEIGENQLQEGKEENDAR